MYNKVKVSVLSAAERGVGRQIVPGPHGRRGLIILNPSESGAS